MLTTSIVARSLILAAVAVAWDAQPAPAQAVDGPPADLKASAAELYVAYGSALATPRRNAIASFYHYTGALVVFNGVARRMSRAELEAKYRGPWTPPAFFAWENLSFDSIGPGSVIVTGGFKWQTPGQPDTTRYVYAALVVAVDSGMSILFEHETLRPAK
jgi:hypothetical protein